MVNNLDLTITIQKDSFAKETFRKVYQRDRSVLYALGLMFENPEIKEISIKINNSHIFTHKEVDDWIDKNTYNGDFWGD